ncbi:MAG: MFS transporter [Nitrospirae bacterium]|nr:MFS transporter [Nitrospirota bacterium]
MDIFHRIFKKDELRLLWPFYLMFLLLCSFAVIEPIWMIFLRKHFSFSQISLALALQCLAIMLFEVPTGAIADIRGRKVSVILSLALEGFLWIILPFVRLPFSLCLLFFVMGIFRTLGSGADKAWMIDWLKFHNRDDLSHDMFVKTQSLVNIGFSIGALLSTFLLFFLDMDFLFFIRGGSFILVGCFLAFFSKESPHEKQAHLHKDLREFSRTISQGFSILLKNKNLFYLLIATVFTYITFSGTVFAVQPLLVSLSLPVRYLGTVYSLITISGIVIPFLSKRILRLIGTEQKYLAVTTLVQFLSLILLFFVDKPLFGYAVLIILSVEAMSNLKSPVDTVFFHSFIPSETRATVGSVQNMILSIFPLLSILFAGHIMDKIGSKMMVLSFSFFLIPAVIFYLLISKDEDVEKSTSKLNLTAA